ncbi:S49 family peptidase [Azotobacter beijerinckii]|uniref:S49 family peptidase n=1 Tax=Azotobacter beijerinckii TaxID=170623 RepID=UPI00295305B7|nr:S49 family peptidase [Azotobacter beijerinckii]MDV7211229.1 S49 family peptidase [Azotobacter beijerinckii]
MDDKELGLILKELMSENLQERKRTRLWGIFFKCLGFTYLAGTLAVFTLYDPKNEADNYDSYTGVVTVRGEIKDDENTGYLTVNKILRKAFEDEKTKGVIVAINSPGGSPVHSHRIYLEMQRLQKKYPEKPLYAVVGDLAASGGYFIAAGAKAIYADETSLVGSIGVTAAGFGFVGAMEKLGVERRNYTSGEHKSLLDPYSPQKPDEVELWNDQLRLTHEKFIEAVKSGRGERLRADTPNLFSGLLWNATEAKVIGLIDEFGSIETVARDVIQAEHLKEFNEEPNPLARLADRLGASIGAGFAGGAVQSVLEAFKSQKVLGQ